MKFIPNQSDSFRFTPKCVFELIRVNPKKVLNLVRCTNRLKINLTQSEICNPSQNSIRFNPSLKIRMNPNLE